MECCSIESAKVSVELVGKYDLLKIWTLDDRIVSLFVESFLQFCNDKSLMIRNNGECRSNGFHQEVA